jgi:hypothetical protein
VIVDVTPFEVVTEIGLEPFRPTNTQLVAELQLIALTAVTVAVSDGFAVHVDPPSELVRIRAGCAARDEPAA